MVNRPILISVAVIGAISFYRAIAAKKPLSRIVVGTYILLLALSALDMFGGPISDIAGGIAMLAALYVVLRSNDIWDALTKAVNPPKQEPGGAGGGGTPTYK